MFRADCLRCRWLAQRAQKRKRDLDTAVEKYKNAKRLLKRAIKVSKAQNRKTLCEEVNKDPWGLGYQIVTQKIGTCPSPVIRDKKTMRNIVDTLSPDDEFKQREKLVSDNKVISPFTASELKAAINLMKSGKAPGPDGVPIEAIKLAYQTCPQEILDIYNSCLTARVFLYKMEKAKASSNTETQ